MSFSATTKQVQDQTKTVTRRMGWRNLKVGDELWAVKKSMGLRKGETIEKLARIRVTDVRREGLRNICIFYDVEWRFRKTKAHPFAQAYLWSSECEAEGFPLMEGQEFVALFRKINNCTAEVKVTRIEFEYLDWDPPPPPQQELF